MDISAYWAALILTAVICIFFIFRAMLHPRNALSYPLLFCLIYLYFYVVQSYFVATNLRGWLADWMLIFGQVVVLVALIAFLIGWHVGVNSPVKETNDAATPESINPQTAWVLAVLAILIGVIAQTWFFSEFKNKQDSTVAYIFLAFHLGYPGTLVCLQTAAYNRSFRGIVTLGLPILLLGLILSPAIFYARRGPMYPTAVILLYGFGLARGRVPSRLLLIGGLVGVGTLMLFLVTIRDNNTEEGGSWRSEHIEERLESEDIFVGKAKQAEDNEFLYHCGIVSGCYELGICDYGTAYATLLTHWIPRAWWPDKPALGESLIGGDILFELPKVTGWKLTGGAACGGVGDSYIHVGYMLPAFWFFYGWIAARRYKTAIVRLDLIAQTDYIAILASSHWFIAQGFAESFVPLAIYVVVPRLIYKFSKVKHTADFKDSAA